MDFNLGDIGHAIGSFLGNGGQAEAAGIGVQAANVALGIRQDILNALNKAGQNIGSVLGTAIPEQIAAGAQQTGAGAVQGFEQKYLGFSLSNTVTVVGLAVVGVLLWMLIRLARR